MQVSEDVIWDIWNDDDCVDDDGVPGVVPAGVRLARVLLLAQYAHYIYREILPTQLIVLQEYLSTYVFMCVFLFCRHGATPTNYFVGPSVRKLILNFTHTSGFLFIDQKINDSREDIDNL